MENEDRLAKLEEEENNPMKALENKTQDSKREMDILDALQDIRARNARNERVAAAGGSEMLDKIAKEEIEGEEEKAKRLADEEDEQLVREVFSKVRAGGASGLGSALELEAEDAETEAVSTITIKRKADGDAPDIQQLLAESESKAKPPFRSPIPPPPSFKKQKTELTKSLGIKLKKAKAIVQS